VQYSEHVAGWSCSTFPLISREAEKRYFKDPITSFFTLDMSVNRHTCVLTTGCNYGSRAMESSLTASTESLHELTRCQSKIGTSKQAAVRLLRGMHTAHDAILKGSQEIFTETEVQIFCGMACRLPNLQNSLNSDWIFICANLGNIKAFHWSYRTKKLKEITTGNESLELSGKNMAVK